MNFSAPEPLTANHDLSEFDSGENSLNIWLKNKALQNQLSGASRVFVTCTDNNKVMAYYALSTGIVHSYDAVGRFKRNMPIDIPVVLLGRLAVDNQARGIGLGRALIRDAAIRVIQAADLVGIRGIIVHALSQEAKQFYQHVGFYCSSIHPMLLMITVQDIKKALGLNTN
ncbi:GNAT family N-acetyltransferase [Proteus hauseri]|uniref:GNAT family N-acetyltransferase n=1 Tax=Proteus hauseri TaxID=183417 RepID=UPI0032DBF2D4